MSPDGTFADASGVSEWHTIRPGKPPLSLSVREITSVSVTFILSSTFSDLGPDAEPFFASLGLAAEDDNEEDDADDETDDSVSAEQKKSSVISEALAKGLSVNVNSAIWKGVYIRIDEKNDEAVIIIYGLMPGKKYDIDLGLVQGGQSNNIRRQVITDDLEIQSQKSLSEGGVDRFDPAESPLPSPSTSPGHATATTPPAANSHPQFTLEDRFSQLQRALSQLSTDRDALTLSLKTTRRDAQKADAALRSEIEILKRASEKHAVSEHRARQKVLALQEAVKRAQISTREMDEMVLEVEAELPALLVQRADKEEAYSNIKQDADQARKEKDREAEKERRKLDIMKSELAGLNNKMDRLNGKREKLESSVIPDLEEQLHEIELEIERVAADPLGYAYSHEPPGSGDGHEQPNGYNHAAQWAGRQQVPGILTRPSPIPIQRPGQQNPSTGPVWHPQAPMSAVLPAQQQQHQRSASSRAPAPRSPVALRPVPPQRHSSIKSASASDSSSSLNSSPTSAPATAAAPTPASRAMLSGRAPPFEPGRIAVRPGVYSVSGAGSSQWARGSGTHKWVPS
ncbi:hypothetical protein GGX14DRAFT_456510 [Mycena pura]|uniref:Uncharacterized protein n=1 Tax=Mycena pura TaxID=153505 RepID=A0AAD6VE60_9AGAR|nr:hypothetical protein GGX14DRAFT_456510 [Mycena pura]